jgi:ribosomal protein S8E
MLIRKLKVGALVVALLGIGVLLLLQQQQIKRLAVEGAELRAQLAQAASLRENNEHLSEQLKAAGEASQADRTELMRLRGQGVRLRQLEQENAQLKAQREQLARQMREAQLAVASSDQRQTSPASDVKVRASVPPVNETNLGMVELSDGIAARIDLGAGTNCVITPTVLSDGNAQMQITVEVTNADGTASQLGQARLTARPGQHCSISVDDRMIALTPRLKAQ